MKDDVKKDTNRKESGIQKQLDEMENNWKRALADYKNLQKRVEEEKEEIVSFSNMILLSRLLPILDNLELLEKHGKDEGVKMIVKEFKDVLKDAGLEEIEAEGKEFDPMTMEAVDMEGDHSDTKATVTSVVRRGFKMKDRLIRPARVVVTKK